MRHGRAKQARRTLQFFERAAGIRPPYRLLLDGTFVIAVLRCKLLPLLRERLDKLLQHAPFDLAVCASTVAELEALQAEQQAAAAKDGEGDALLFAEAIRWCRANCRELADDDAPPHRRKDDDAKASSSTSSSTSSPSTLSAAAADILRVACHANNNNSNNNTAADEAKTQKKDERIRSPLRYFCATQDEELLDRLRRHPTTVTVPIIRLARGSVLLLEQPSKMAAGAAQREERQKWTHTTSEPEQKLVELVRRQKKAENKQSMAALQPRQRKKPKARGPNPLSCKKRTASDAAKTENKRKRRRKNKNESTTS